MFEMFRRELLIERKNQGAYVDGYWQEGQKEYFTILASVQGTDAFVLQTLQEGTSTSGAYTLRTDAKLLIGTSGVNTPDVVIIDDERFLVVRVTPWQNLAHTKHYEVVVVRENKDAD